jgi:alkylated DNA repair protein alkB family protein 1
MYKKYQKMDDAAIDNDLNVVDFTRGLSESQKERIVSVEEISSELITSATKAFKAQNRADGEEVKGGDKDENPVPKPCTVYEDMDFPGTLSPLEFQLKSCDLTILYQD